MQIYHFRCKSCGYETKLPLGSSDLDQTLTDVNTDYAEYPLFKCPIELRFIHADIHDREFEGKCPADGSDLIEIKEMPPLKCPRCNQNRLAMHETKPMDEQQQFDIIK